MQKTSTLIAISSLTSRLKQTLLRFYSAYSIFECFLKYPFPNSFNDRIEMNRLCDYVLAADENIHFATAIDEIRNMLCMKAMVFYQLPREAAKNSPTLSLS
ncbi:MAG: hypothetical protein OEY24_01385 [Candidatus Bathyarchaeota archaeon]|nr:hypothetical protein [Candidatus Bathyarchaeota archaeon]